MTVNALDPRVFAPSASRDVATGEVSIGGVAVSQLVEQFGSPVYVIDEHAVRETATRVRGAFHNAAMAHETTARVYYASKALLNLEVARWMAEAGLGIDVASGGELEVALAAGIDPATIGFHGNNKSVAEIMRAVEVGVGTIVIDSEIETRRIAQAVRDAQAHGRSAPQKVSLRVNSGVHASTHEFLATSHEDQKFGQPLAEAPRLVAEIAGHPELEFVGLHCHIGSQIFATGGFRESAKRLLSVYPELSRILGRPVPELNLGGGYGIAYSPQEAEEVPSIEVLAREIVDEVADRAGALGIPVPALAFEPGRVIVGQAGITLYTVGTVKPVALGGFAERIDPRDDGESERLYVSVDGGMSDNARPALYGADYHVRIANRHSDAPGALVRVVGKHCEAGDIVVRRDWLPGDVAPGDVLAVAATGAYCWSLSSNYNYVPRPPMLAVRDGAARVIVRGETVADLVAQSAGEGMTRGTS